MREQEAILTKKNEQVDRLIKELEVKSRDAKIKADEVSKIADECKAQAE